MTDTLLAHPNSFLAVFTISPHENPGLLYVLPEGASTSDETFLYTSHGIDFEDPHTRETIEQVLSMTGWVVVGEWDYNIEFWCATVVSS